MFSKRKPIKYTQFFDRRQLERVSNIAAAELSDSDISEIYVPSGSEIESSASMELRAEFRRTLAEPILPHLIDRNMLRRKELSRIDSSYWRGNIRAMDLYRPLGIGSDTHKRAVAVVALTGKVMIGDSRDYDNAVMLFPTQALLLPSGRDYFIEAVVDSSDELGSLVATVNTQRIIN